MWHKGLIFKLKQFGIEGDLLEWISDYLSGRKQIFVIRNSSSSLRRINAGVPEGSVLGPLLFLVYVIYMSMIYLNLYLVLHVYLLMIALYFTLQQTSKTRYYQSRLTYVSQLGCSVVNRF